jgi:hypothetical protein
MGAPARETTGTAGLSCYTAALHRYLAAEWDATAILARSVRLSVRAGEDGSLLAFSHHHPSLDLLPDGSRLRYAGAGSGAGSGRAALAGVAAELDRHGRAIVVTDSGRLPWSITYGGPSSPHWLLVEGHDARGWRVVDDFTALHPDGEQLPHTGWLDDAGLAEAMNLPARWPQPAHRMRNALAFGATVAVTPGRALWLRRSSAPAAPIRPNPDGGSWRAGEADALTFLIDRATADERIVTEHLDDLWAAAGHQAFACRWRLDQPRGELERARLAAAHDRWSALPRVLRVAVESAARGRPRISLVRATLVELRTVVDG